MNVPLSADLRVIKTLSYKRESYNRDSNMKESDYRYDAQSNGCTDIEGTPHAQLKGKAPFDVARLDVKD